MLKLQKKNRETLTWHVSIVLGKQKLSRNWHLQGTSSATGRAATTKWIGKSWRSKMCACCLNGTGNLVKAKPSKAEILKTSSLQSSSTGSMSQGRVQRRGEQPTWDEDLFGIYLQELGTSSSLMGCTKGVERTGWFLCKGTTIFEKL